MQPSLRCHLPIVFGLSFAVILAARLTARADLMPSKDTAEVARQLPTAGKLEGGIRFTERKAGAGPHIAKGDRVTALYVGRFHNGKSSTRSAASTNRLLLRLAPTRAKSFSAGNGRFYRCRPAAVTPSR